MSAWISILGLFNHYPDLFDDMQLPQVADIANDKIEYIDHITPLDRDLLISNIMLELGELGLVYTDPTILRHMIGIWSRIEKSNWLALWETLLYKYNPIWNKDGDIFEERDIQREGETSGTKTGTSSNTRTLGTLRTSEETVTVSGQVEDIATNRRTEAETGTITDEHSKTGTGTERDSGTITDVTGKTSSGSEKDTGTVSDSGSKTVNGNSSSQKTIAHNVTGFDTNSYSPNTQDVENGTVNSSESTEESTTRTLNTTKTVSGSEDVTATKTLNTTKTLNDSESGTDERTLDTEKVTQDSGTRSGTSSDRRSGTGTVRDSGTITDEGQSGETNSGTSTGTESERYHRREQGNIGVTMTQDMISKQREIVEFNIYRYITESFKKRFCIMVY